MNVKPIVLATDGSPSAAEATLEAIELARAFDVPLVAVSVEHPPTIVGSGFYGYGEILCELKKVECERVERTLEQTCAAAAEAGVECEAVHAGDEASITDQICRIADARKARMIVIGAHGWSPVGRVLHGSVSTAVVHQSRCPVLVVSSGVEPIDLSVAKLDEIVHAEP